MGKKHRIKGARKAKSLIEQIDAEIKQIDLDMNIFMASAAQQVADILSESAPRRVALGDILNDEQMQAVVDILNRTDIDEYRQTNAIKNYLKRYEKELEAIGVSYTYLTYVVLVNAPALRELSAASNSKPDDPFRPPPNSQN